MNGTSKERRIMGVMTVGCAAIALGDSVSLGILEKQRTQAQVATANHRAQVSKWQDLERRRGRMSHATVAAAVNAR